MDDSLATRSGTRQCVQAWVLPVDDSLVTRNEAWWC